MATTSAPSTIVSAQVSLEQRAELERRAAEADRSLSAEVRRALTRYLARDAEPAASDHESKEGTT